MTEGWRAPAVASASGGRLLAAALAILAATLLAACLGTSETNEHSTITVSDARAQFTTTDLGAVYFDIRVTGVGDRLVAVSSTIAEGAQLHEIVTEGSTSAMRAVEGGIPVDPGGRVRLEPGGQHVMLLGVAEIPEPGETFELVLEFERAGSLTVTVRVEAFGGGAEDSHD